MAAVLFKKFVQQKLPFFLPLIQFVEKYFTQIVLLIITLIFLLTYFESLRWPLPGPKATHGIAKGLSLVLAVMFTGYWRQKKTQFSSHQNLLMGIFCVSYFVSAVFSLDLETSLLHLWYPFMATLIFFFLPTLSIKKEYFSLITVISVLLVFVTFVFSFFSIIFRYSVDNLYYFIFLDHRANHLLGEIRKFGKYVSLGPYLMLVPLIVSPLIEKGAGLTKKLLAFAVFLMALLTAVISNNRIDVLIFALQFVVYLFVLSRRQIIALVLPVLLFIWFGLFVTETYFGFNLEERIVRPELERDRETVDMRYTYWQTALNNFRNFPLFGTGPNTYNVVSDFPLRRYYSQGVREYTFLLDEGIGVHNIFIERLADTGLFGFFSFVVLLFYFGRTDVLVLIRLKTRRDQEGFKKYLLYSLGSWSWIMYGITDNGYGAQGFMTFFFLRALLPHVSKTEYVKQTRR